MIGLLLFLAAAAPELVSGSFAAGRGPDGNSVFLEAPQGLILVDTGRHPEHQERLIALARARGRPIAAIVNTHWHLDHSGGNAEIRAAFPGIPLFATEAVDSALSGFFPNSRADAEAFLAAGRASAALTAEIERDFAAMDDPANLRPDRPVTRSGPVEIAGRTIEVRVARNAATEADLWLWDEGSRTVIGGDLVVAMVPFLDTACPEGWRAALAEIAAVPFGTLIPGHGAPMDRAAFERWRSAFGNLLDCAASAAGKEQCAAGWVRDAAEFVGEGGKRAAAMAEYYVQERLRAPPEVRNRYCSVK